MRSRAPGEGGGGRGGVEGGGEGSNREKGTAGGVTRASLKHTEARHTDTLSTVGIASAKTSSNTQGVLAYYQPRRSLSEHTHTAVVLKPKVTHYTQSPNHTQPVHKPQISHTHQHQDEPPVGKPKYTLTHHDCTNTSTQS